MSGTDRPPAAGVSVMRKPVVGDVIEGKYSVIAVLGEGGMGTVHLAEHKILGDQVAIKTVHPSMLVDETVVSRFMNEAKAAARLKTEHVVKILDVAVSAEHGPFIVMEPLDGRTVADVLAEREPFSARELADLLLPMLEALAMAHAVGVVHRDLKPANLFL